MARMLSRKLIYDLEDNAILRVDSDVNKFIQFFKNPNKIKFLIVRSDHVITSSPALNDYCLNLNYKNKCTYISSSVDTDNFLPVNQYQNDKKIVIGWTGTFSSRKYLDLLRQVFIELSKRCEFKLLIIGNFEYSLPGVNLEVIQWSKESEVRDLQRIDIGVYPLSKDEWVSGKSGLKAIQYMAFGLPTVATDIGTTSIIIKHKENGYLVNSEEEWLHALEELIRNPELRKKLGSKARELIIKNYSINAIKMKYLSIINKD
jgi:glycosyltransferase involved in cell wall biosynthesis